MRHNRAFTLIELLVVVAIIIALLAILMPSLNKAIEATARVRCMSNLHQQQIGHVTYASDNFGKLTPGYPGIGGAVIGATQVWQNGKFIGSGKLFEIGYLPDGRIFYCPTSTHPFYQYGVNPIGWPEDNQISTATHGWIGATQYYRASFGADISMGTLGRMLQMSDGGNQALLADGFGRSDVAGSGVNGSTTLGELIHGRAGYSVVRLDGSGFWYDDPEHEISQFIKTTPGGGALYYYHEEVWRDDFGKNQ